MILALVCVLLSICCISQQWQINKIHRVLMSVSDVANSLTVEE